MADPGDPASLCLAKIERWLTVVGSAGGAQHAVLSDGCQRIRLDLPRGGLTGAGAVELSLRFEGIEQARRGVLPLQRLLALARHGRFTATLNPRDAGVARGLLALRVHDGLSQGASYREIAEVIYGADRLVEDEARGSQSLRSRVRRLAAEARGLAGGGYRLLLRKAPH